MTVTRWTRYGKDRLYVRADDGTDVGWWDLLADTGHAASPTTADFLARAVADWRSGQPTSSRRQQAGGPEDADDAVVEGTECPGPGLEQPNTAQPVAWGSGSPAVGWAPSPGPPVVDLAYNRAGAQLQNQVEAARADGQKPTLLRRFFLGKHAYSTWERGLIGEQLVEAELHKLVQHDPWWGYINSIPVGENGSDIDHLLVGLPGVFTINSKYHRGCNVWVAGNTYMVNGQRQPFIRNARFEAQRSSRILTKACGFPVSVVGLVVPAGARDFTVREQPADVHVVNRARLVDYLRCLPPVMRPEHREAILAAARLSTTWKPQPK